MSDHLDRAAEAMWGATTSDGLRAAIRPDCWEMAKALDAAGLLVTPARDEAIRADERAKVLAEFTEWFAPGFTYPNGRTAPIGRETVAREFAAAEARDTASPEDDTPTLVVRRLVGPWEPIEDEGGAS